MESSNCQLATLLVIITICCVRAEVTSMTPANDVIRKCPTQCRCDVITQSAECRAANITDLTDTLRQLDPATTMLDLRANQITTLRSRGFLSAGLTSLSVILLDDNLISEIEPQAFQGLTSVKLISLQRNRLTAIGANAFSDVTGDENGTYRPWANNASGIDLTRNNIVSIDKYAFAWIKGLQVSLGRSDVAMTINAYAFYNARSVSRVRIGRVPALTLRPRLFTNAEDIEQVEIHNTNIGSLEQFVFEGLKNVEKIALANVSVASVRSFAFSGVHFKRKVQRRQTQEDSELHHQHHAGVTSRRRKQRTERYANSGGVVSFTACHVQLIQKDAFRDTNIAHVTILSSHLGVIEPHAFQDVSGLMTFRISGSHFEYGRLPQDSLSSLRGLQKLILDDNDFYIIEPFAFRDVTDIDLLSIRFRSASATLMTESFSRVSDVDHLEIFGQMTSSGVDHTKLFVDVGAFRNLVGVENVRIDNFQLPVVARHSFAGLSRIRNLTISNCGVRAVEKEAFGDMTSHVGVIEHFNIGTGNQLQCDCVSGTTLCRELELRFIDYVAYCYHSMAAGELVDVHEASLHPVCQPSDASWQTVASSLYVVSLTCIAILYNNNLYI